MENRERPVTWLLILACLFHYAALMMPVASNVCDAVAVMLCLGLIVEGVLHVTQGKVRA